MPSPRRVLSCSWAWAVLWVPLAVSPFVLGACATTKPWERGALAQPEMEPDEDADSARLRGHYRGTREGAVGGFGGGGGGCGCN